MKTGCEEKDGLVAHTINLKFEVEKNRFHDSSASAIILSHVIYKNDIRNLCENVQNITTIFTSGTKVLCQPCR